MTPRTRRALGILGAALGCLVVVFLGFAAGRLLRVRRAPPPPRPHVTGSLFRDVTHESGIRFRSHVDDGAGVALADVDGDGHLDALFIRGGTSGAPSDDCARLFRNQGDGTFADATELSGLKACGRGVSALFADLDGDGDVDLVIANDGAEPTLWKNDGRGRFAQMSGTGVPRTAAAGAMAAFDANGDGAVDLYLGRDAAENAFLGGKGDFTFLDVTERTHTGRRGSSAAAIAAFDAGGDGWTDLAIVDERAAGALLASETFGRFRELPLACAAAGGRGLLVDDLDGDGRPDLLVTRRPGGPAVCRGEEGMRFAEAGGAFHGAAPGGRAAVAIDHDDDGRDDLAFSNGALLFRNVSAAGAIRFEHVPELSGEFAGRGLAAGDLDGDGRVDLVVNPIDTDAIVLKNETKGGRSIEILPIAGADRKTVLGTKVTVDGRTKEFQVVSSYAAGSWVPLHFGLGDRAEAHVVVRWPDGSVWDSGTAVKPGSYRLRKGSTALVGRARVLQP